MNSIKAASLVAYPDGDLTENFSFSVLHADGVFRFLFRWFNDRWNAWCTLPSGEVRALGVEPNVVSWVGFTDYGIVFGTDLTVIDKDSLALTELYILEWE